MEDLQRKKKEFETNPLHQQLSSSSTKLVIIRKESLFLFSFNLVVNCQIPHLFRQMVSLKLIVFL
jgi:hypothetical protein